MKPSKSMMYHTCLLQKTKASEEYAGGRIVFEEIEVKPCYINNNFSFALANKQETFTNAMTLYTYKDFGFALDDYILFDNIQYRILSIQKYKEHLEIKGGA